jgi:aryl-alcohol dehydrogenase-like predicted oxidoreductase
MKTRELGRLPARVSAVGLGTAQLANLDGSVAGIRLVAPADAKRILEVAVEGGVSFFDTGDQYGAAEELIGSLSPSLRARVLVATKAGLRDDGKRDFTPAYLRSRLERSLKRLKTERLDLFQLNKPSATDWQDGRLASFLNEEKQRGRLRFAGVVVGEAADGLRALEETCVDTVQVLFHLLYHGAIPVIAEAARLGKGVIVRSPLNSGLLSGSYRADTVIPSTDERSRYFAGPEFQRRVSALQAIQRDLGVPDDQLVEYALRFCLSEPGVSTVIPGASRLEQSRRYAACGDAEPMSPQELAKVKAAVAARMSGVGGAFQLH